MAKNFTKFILAIVFLGSIFIGCENTDDIVENIEQDLGHHNGKQTNVIETIEIVSKGNPDVSKAIEDPEIKIKELKINGKSGLSYSYEIGDLSKWGLAYSQADALAIAGYLENGKYVCRKFDWISTSRKTRDFNNIKERYNGWEPNKFFSAEKHCFFIMSKDGCKRTNIITD